MIAGVEGTIESRGANRVVIRVGGVSLVVYVPASTMSQLGASGESVRLHTHLSVREDNIALYGFSSQEELELFTTLIAVGGVGPKMALAMLSALSAEQLALAIARGDIEFLSQMPGIGKKTASRLVLELKGKLEKGWAGAAPSYLTQDSADVVAALTNLGYSAAEASRALAAIADSADLSLADRIKLALQHLAGK